MLRCACARFCHDPKTCARGCALLWAAGLRPQAIRLAAEHNRQDIVQVRANRAEHDRIDDYRDRTGRSSGVPQ